MKRVVITGMGAVTPLGNNCRTFWNGIKEGKVGIDYITRFDTAEFKPKLAAEVKNFDPEAYLPRKEARRMDLFCQFAVVSALQAMDDSGLDPEYVRGNFRIGVMMGSGIGGLNSLEENILKMGEKGPGRISPLFIPMAISNMASGHISIMLGSRGGAMSVVTACATGNNCIGEAFRNIKHGYSDVIFAGGSEASISKIGIGGFSALTALSNSTDPQRASIPFDRDRNGFVMGEGGGCLVVEELEHALKRNAKIYAEIIGYGSTCDSYHMTAPSEDGSGCAEAIRLALSEADIAPTDVTYVNAHGTSTELNDLAETKALKAAFGEHAYNLYVSSTKSMTGHLLGAAGAAEAIVLALSLKEGFIPMTAGLQNPGEGCDLNYVMNSGEDKAYTYGITTSLGFGGHNAVLCFKQWKDGSHGL